MNPTRASSRHCVFSLAFENPNATAIAPAAPRSVCFPRPRHPGGDNSLRSHQPYPGYLASQLSDLASVPHTALPSPQRTSASRRPSSQLGAATDQQSQTFVSLLPHLPVLSTNPIPTLIARPRTGTHEHPGPGLKSRHTRTCFNRRPTLEGNPFRHPQGAATTAL